MNSTWLLALKNTTPTAENASAGQVKVNGEYFVFGPAIKLKLDHDETNIDRFKDLMDMTMEEQKLELVIGEVGPKDGGLLKLRQQEFVKNNNEVANFFLRLLHNFFWKRCEFADGKFKNNSVISGIKINDAIKKLKPVIIEMNNILNELLDQKYNTKFATTLIDKNMKDISNEISWKNNPFAKFK